MNNGWIKLYRKTLDNQVLSNDMVSLGIFVSLLMLVDKKTGSYSFGTRRLPAQLNVDRSKFLRVLKSLQEQTVIRTETNRKYTTLYICNWHTYQTDSEPISDQKQTKIGPISDTKQEEEREEEKNNRFKIEIQGIYDRYIQAFNSNENQYKLTPKRRIKIAARIKDSGVEMVNQAIDKTAASSFHMGDNARGWKADLDWIMKSYEQIEKLAGMQVKVAEQVDNFKIDWSKA